MACSASKYVSRPLPDSITQELEHISLHISECRKTVKTNRARKVLKELSQTLPKYVIDYRDTVSFKDFGTKGKHVYTSTESASVLPAGSGWMWSKGWSKVSLVTDYVTITGTSFNSRSQFGKRKPSDPHYSVWVCSVVTKSIGDLSFIYCESATAGEFGAPGLFGVEKLGSRKNAAPIVSKKKLVEKHYRTAFQFPPVVDLPANNDSNLQNCAIFDELLGDCASSPVELPASEDPLLQGVNLDLSSLWFLGSYVTPQSAINYGWI